MTKTTALGAIVKRFSATIEAGPRGVYVRVGGKRVALDTLSFKPQLKADSAKPKLRFDKVVASMMRRLGAAAERLVPDGMTLLVTVTAPIRQGSRTAAALEKRIQALVMRGGEHKATINGNGIRLRLLKDPSGRAPRLIGFVHNRETDPLLLFTMTSDILRLAQVEARKPRGPRWLVVTNAGSAAWLDAYRLIYSGLQRERGYQKILLAFEDGRIEPLAPAASADYRK